jgi:hypothetical protein
MLLSGCRFERGQTFKPKDASHPQFPANLRHHPTLDEAFGIEKRAQDNRGIAKKHRETEKMCRVWNLVLLATKEDDAKRAPKNKVSRYEKKLRPDGTRRALDNELFEDIAEPLGINS